MNYFFVPEERYFAAYNDYEFIFHTKQQQGRDYVDVHFFYVSFKKHFPEYGIEYELNTNGTNLFYLKSTVANTETLLVQKQDTLTALEKVDSKDWKTKKKLETKLQELNNEITYGYRGVVVRPYVINLETGARTQALDFPIMAGDMNSVINPDSRDITDGLARAEVKCGGRYTGLFYRLFTRENLGDDLEQAQHTKVIKAIVAFSEQLGLPVDKSIVHFGTPYPVLKQLATELQQKTKS